MSEVVISARELCKRYDVFPDQWSRLAHALWSGGRGNVKEIRALESVSFDVQRGESVAIIGRNGSGKSTMLQILAGTLAPTSGQFAVAGRVCALLELGSGFSPEYSGRDNALLNGLLLGMSREQIVRKLDEIVEFAEIGDAIDRSAKTYSSGMLARLAFAVQVALDPDVLIVDEALSVGDFFFQQKCAAHIRQMQRRGVTILFVSHDMGMVRNVCSRAIYLRAGELVFDGDADRAALMYFQEGDASQMPHANGVAKAAGKTDRASTPTDAQFYWQSPPGPEGSTEPRIMGVDFRNVLGQQSLNYRIGERLSVRALVADLRTGCVPALTIKNAIGQVVNVTYYDEVSAGAAVTGCGRAIFNFEIDLALEAGGYSFQVYLGEPTGPNIGSVVCESPVLGPVLINWNYEVDRAPFYGMFGLPAKVSARICDP